MRNRQVRKVRTPKGTMSLRNAEKLAGKRQGWKVPQKQTACSAGKGEKVV